MGLTSTPSYLLKGYGYPRLVTMTVFGCRVSEDRLKLRWHHVGLEWSLINATDEAGYATWTYKGHSLRKGTDWGDSATKNPRGCLHPPERDGMGPPVELPGESQPVDALILAFSLPALGETSRCQKPPGLWHFHSNHIVLLHLLTSKN